MSERKQEEKKTIMDDPAEQVGMLVATWEAIPFTVRVMIIAFLAVVALTEVWKRVLLADIEPKSKKHRYIWGLSFIIGVLVAISGYIVTDTMPDWFWLFVGATAGFVSNVAHHLVVKVWWKSRVEKKRGNIKVVTRKQILRVPKEEGDEDPTRFIVSDD